MHLDWFLEMFIASFGWLIHMIIALDLPTENCWLSWYFPHFTKMFHSSNLPRFVGKFSNEMSVCVYVLMVQLNRWTVPNKALNKHSDDTQWNQMDKLLQSWRCELTNEKWINTENTLNWMKLISLWLPSDISIYFLDTPIDVVVWHCSFTFQKLHQMWSQAKQIEKHWFNFVWWVRGEVMLDFWFFFCCCWSKQMVRCGKTVFSTH